MDYGPLYLTFKTFSDEHPLVSLQEFEEAINDQLSLFTTASDFDFEELKEKINKINALMPSINAIFKRPLLHLKEEGQVMPVEAVSKTDVQTFNHVFSHSELWEDLVDQQIKPSKLLTRISQDNYGIYENLVFCDTIDDILGFADHMKKTLYDFILAKDAIEINLFERNNHLLYWQALGKLYPGYLRWYNEFCQPIQENFKALEQIHTSISSRLKMPVYAKNKSRNTRQKLKKTNILAMHKYYRKIYSFRKSFDKTQKVEKELDVLAFAEGYFNYCILLLVFSLLHFGFTSVDSINFKNLNMNFANQKWRINIKENQKKILITTKKDQIVEVELDTTNIAIDDLESFRRMQQIILKSMIEADQMFDVCPYCQAKLVDKGKGVYLCQHCRTIIGKARCPQKNQEFYYTSIYGIRHQAIRKEDFLDVIHYQKAVEKQMNFRNITKINNFNEIICPLCGQVHGGIHEKYI